MNYWLMKSEPTAFSIYDLKNKPHQTDCWNGVRNYQARNIMRDQMKKGDLAFFYHSSCELPGIVGIIEISKEGYPDFTAWDATDPHFDPKSTPENPIWFMVDVCFKQLWEHPVALNELRRHPELNAMPLLRKGCRLSVMPVTSKEWNFILALSSTTTSA